MLNNENDELIKSMVIEEDIINEDKIKDSKRNNEMRDSLEATLGNMKTEDINN